MALRGWSWGGSTAPRVGTLRRSDLEARWSRSLSSDTPVPAGLEDFGLRARWAPDAFVLDKATATPKAFFRPVHVVPPVCEPNGGDVQPGMLEVLDHVRLRRLLSPSASRFLSGPAERDSVGRNAFRGIAKRVSHPVPHAVDPALPGALPVVSTRCRGHVRAPLFHDRA